MAKIFQTIDDLRFFWINVYFGIQLQYGSEKDDTWSAADIWHNTLEPWEPWIG